jgi:hypothetical protein
MITCKLCKKFAKLKNAYINGLGEVKLCGSCKHCGYDEKADYPAGHIDWNEIPESNIDYTDFEELGFEEEV